MTLDEMSGRIWKWCEETGNSCKGCPLEQLQDMDGFCFSYEGFDNGEELLKKHYEILFGKEETEGENMEDTKTVMTAEQKIEILRQMSADAFEWATGMEACDGYWRGVSYMMSSVLEMGNETN